MIEDKKHIVLQTVLIVNMPDGSRWAIPTEVIARNRAKEYVDEFDGDVERSLLEDTCELFLSEDSGAYEIHDWAANNMDWSEVKEHARKITEPPILSDEGFQEGWMNGDWQVVGPVDLVDSKSDNCDIVVAETLKSRKDIDSLISVLEHARNVFPEQQKEKGDQNAPARSWIRDRSQTPDPNCDFCGGVTDSICAYCMTGPRNHE